MNEKKDVEFKVERGRYGKLPCDCCENVKLLIHISIPKTGYYDDEDSSIVVYSPLWICDKCADKLIAALRVGR